MRTTAIRWSSACATIQTVKNLFREHWPTSAEVYLPGGDVPEPGTLFTNRALAATYRASSRGGKRRGGDRVGQIERARALVAGLRRRGDRSLLPQQEVMDVSGEPHRGVLTGDDMAALAGACRGAAHLRLRPLHRLQGRAWSQGR
jgi:gamma-glutamyltranspeptidase / glutathione hydrolase